MNPSVSQNYFDLQDDKEEDATKSRILSSPVKEEEGLRTSHVHFFEVGNYDERLFDSSDLSNNQCKRKGSQAT